MPLPIPVSVAPSCFFACWPLLRPTMPGSVIVTVSKCQWWMELRVQRKSGVSARSAYALEVRWESVALGTRHFVTGKVDSSLVFEWMEQRAAALLRVEGWETVQNFAVAQRCCCSPSAEGPGDCQKARRLFVSCLVLKLGFGRAAGRCLTSIKEEESSTDRENQFISFISAGRHGFRVSWDY